MARWIQTTPGAPGVILTRPTRAMMDIREQGNGVIRVNPVFTVQGISDTTIVNSLTDVVSGDSYGLPSAANSSIIRVTEGIDRTTGQPMKVFSGERSGNPSSNRRGFKLPASVVAGKSQVTIFAVNRVPAETWANHSTASLQTFISYLLTDPPASGAVFGMRIRYTSTGVEASARRNASDATWATARIDFDTSQWHALRCDINYAAGTITITEIMSGVTNTDPTLMLGSGAAAAAGANDWVNLFYQFYSTGTAHGYYGLCSDVIIYPFATGDQRNDALLYHADARIMDAKA